MKINQETIKQMLNDRRLRTKLTTESHKWFFYFYFSHYATAPIAPFHDDMFALTEDRDLKTLVMVAFRGSGKSTIMNMSYPIWSIVGKPQKKFILILGLTQEQARQHLKNIKTELENNERLKSDLGGFKEQEEEWRSTSLIIPKYNAKIMAVSIDQSVRGIRHGQYRPDLIICDDLETLDSVQTLDARDKTERRITGEVIPAGDHNTQIVFIGNLLHEDSLLMRLKDKLQSNALSGKYLEIPLVNDEGTCLWPGRFPTQESIDNERLRIGDEIAWQREYLLKIVSNMGRVILPEWIKYYDEIPDNLDGWWLRNVISIDLAISKKETADYTAILSAKVYVVDGKLQVYILPNIINERMKAFEGRDRVLSLSNELDYPDIYVEEVGYQGMFIEALLHEGCNAEGVKVRGQDKRARLSLVSFMVEKGEVFFPRKNSKELVAQLVDFGVEKHDDLADAFSIMLQQLMSDRGYRRSTGTIMLVGRKLEKHENILTMQF